MTSKSTITLPPGSINMTPRDRQVGRAADHELSRFKSQYCDGLRLDGLGTGADEAALNQFLEAYKAMTDPWVGYSIDLSRIYVPLQELCYLATRAPSGERDISRQYQLWAEISDHLDLEVEKSALFYLDGLQLIVAETSSMRSRWPYLTPSTFGEMYSKCKNIGVKLTDAFEFMDLQLTTLNAVLFFVEHWIEADYVMSRDSWFKTRLAPDNRSSRLKLLCISGDTKHLIAEIVTSLSNMRSLEKEWIDDGVMTKVQCQRFHRRDTKSLIDNLQKKTLINVQKRKWYYHLQAKAIIDYDSKPVGQSTTFGLFVSNLNTFLYMANYYSAVPAANLYAKEVGLNETVSGFLLSMTPMAAVITTYFYSQWSNHSFSLPTRISTIFLIIGNYLYATAATKHSCARLFLGRLFVGAGGNRAANRRYIADFVEMDQRSTQSILFVAVSGLGMAAGPYTQASMEYLSENVTIAGFEINKLTGPPWIFFICWLLFFLTFEFFFQEPSRSFAEPARSVFEPLLQKQRSRDMGQSMLADRKNTIDMPSRISELLGSIVCLWVYFALKLVQEAVQTASPLVTETNFGWSEADASNLLTAIGLVALPTNFCVGILAQLMDGRTLQIVALTGLCLGSLITVDFSGFGCEFSVYQYVIGATCLFLFAQVLEGVNMSLLSIIMPKRFSKGVFNTGFLSTEAGTLGRVCGALTITLAGSLASVEKINNLVMLSCGIISVCTLVLALYMQKQLERPSIIDGDDADELAGALEHMQLSIGSMPFTYASFAANSMYHSQGNVHLMSQLNHNHPAHGNLSSIDHRDAHGLAAQSNEADNPGNIPSMSPTSNFS